MGSLCGGFGLGLEGGIMEDRGRCSGFVLGRIMLFWFEFWKSEILSVFVVGVEFE